MENKFPFNPKTLLIFTIFSCFLFEKMVECGEIGVNWGRQTSHRLIPSMVVDLLLQNGIRNIKLFSPSENVLKAFAGGDIIEITVTLPNEGLQHIINPSISAYWLQERVGKFQECNINIRHVHVGIEPFSTFSRNITYDMANDALRRIQEALIVNGYKNVTATTPHFTDVLKPNIKKPSEADFRPDLKPKMIEFLSIINASKAPFVANIFPIHFASEQNWDIEFSFINNKSNFTIEDNGLIYRNVFEFVYDSFLHAMKKAGAPDLKLMVGHIGWPTDGYPGANTANAERFFREFLPYIKKNIGTPLRPNTSIDVFIHSLADENLNKIDLGAFQRHWGVYRSDGEPKYKIDFTGEGRDIYPTTAKGVVLMPKRWCTYHGQSKNLTKIKKQFELACKEADCTSLSVGGSCSHLTFDQNVSYAFNRYFQKKAQWSSTGKLCDFDGLGKIVTEDPSMGTCVFPVEILAAELPDSGGLNSSGERVHGFFGFVLVLNLLGLLFLGLV
ncbi:Glucan endo-1,3-beta-D-glucosidase [Handroanthus impetiginosus]|uniref:Glucan endo-1,3-beta-D-glucosidase n=1 Tax=Handroanthus impetiginosus TaxID=429701 RepID=A0A2G9H6J4_9LAMI|nr:Glucan endo-1,3-beta-D-glucosidase [Handroanthus impetiginosus]